MAFLPALPAIFAAIGSVASSAAGAIGIGGAAAGAGAAGAAASGAAGGALVASGAADVGIAAGGGIASTAASSATALTTAGTWLNTAGALGSGAAAALNYGYQSQVAKTNASIMAANKSNALQAGQSAESNERIQTGLRVGAMEAAQGASDVDVGFGTTKSSRTSAQTIGDLDALTIRYNAARQAYGYGVDASNFEAQSKLDTTGSTESILSGVLGGARSYIGGASALLNQKLQFQQAGVPGFGG